MKTTRTWLTCLLVLALLLSAVPALAADTSTDEKVTIRFAWWGGQSRHDKMLKIVDEFMKEYPNIIVECEYTGDYFPKLTAQLAAGVEPDVYWCDINSAAMFISKDAFLPLDEYVGNLLDLTDIPEAVVDTGRFNGVLLGIPTGVNASVMMYDPQAFETLGIEKPAVDWTWDDLYAISARFRDEMGIYGLQSPFNLSHHLHFYARTLGYELYNEEGTALGFDDLGLLEDFFNISLYLQEEEYLPTQDVLAQVMGVEDGLLPKGEAAMVFHDSNQITTQSKVAGRPLDFMLMPGPNNGPASFVKPACYTFISSNTKQAEAAVTFLNYFNTDLTAGAIFNGEQGVPGSMKVREHLISTLDGDDKLILQRQFDIIDLVGSLQDPVSLLYPSRHGEIRQLLEDTSEKVLYEVITPAEAAQEFMQEANRILAEG